MATGENEIFALAELARQVRGHTLQFLDLPREWLTWAPAGTSNHILWHAGHSLWVQDALTIERLTNQSELPRDWTAVFREGSRPSSVADWPDTSEIRRQLEAQLTRTLQLLTDSEEKIARHRNESPSHGGWPLLAGMIHGWHDEARHQGEMYLLFKLCRAQQQ